VMEITDILEGLNISELAPKEAIEQKLNALENIPEQLSFAPTDDDEPEERALLGSLTDAPVDIDDIQRT